MRYSAVSLAATAASALIFLGLATVEAASCDPAACVHPTCVCPSMKPPKGLDPATVPQFITLTFDDAVQAQTVPVTRDMMAPHRNPNGCPIKATWFAQTMYSDYSLIQQWYAAGNEVADHTMTHVGTPPLEEIVGNRKAINAFAGIPFNKLAGFRAPFLNYSEDTFQILGQEKFLYDSSTNAVPTDAYWPYTLDHGLANDCWNKICEKPITVPGMWEIPMHAIMDGNTTTAIAHAMDVHLDGTAEAVDKWLKANFDRHYDGDRAPFGIYLHPVHVGASAGLYHDLFTYAAAKPNVWFVTNQQLLQWMQNPVPASEMAAQDYMKCTLPAVGKEICNGLDDSNALTIDKGVLENCNFIAGSWSTCYGCPKTAPTPSDPVPLRAVAAGQPGARSPVPATCAMEWWDPIAAQCLCTSSNCTFTDTAVPGEKKPDSGSGTSGNGGKSAATTQFAAASWTGLAAIVAIAAGLSQLL